MKKRLLFVSNLFPTAVEPYRGLDNATVLHEMGWETRVLSPRPGLPWARRAFEPRPGDEPLRPRWIRSDYLPRIGGGINHLLMARSLRREFEREMAERPPDAILVSWIFPDACAVLRLARGRVPVVAIAQGSDVHHYLTMPARRRVILEMLPGAAAIITRSRELGRLLEEAGVPAGKLHTVYNGVSLETFQPRDKAQARRELGFSDGIRVILFVGNFYEVKNPAMLIRALSRMKTQGAMVVMVGGGQLKEPCQELVDRLNVDVRFVGRKSPLEIARLMNAADVLALPSRNEGVPNVVLEAFASGLRVVATRVGGIPEVLTHESLGRMVPPSDEGAMAEALDAELARKADPGAIRAHGERFSWARMAGQYDAILAGAPR